MSVGEIKHIVEPHPVTGINNGKFGLWLFLASEIMLFGALFSAYIFMRIGAGEEWLPGTKMGLSPKWGAINTAVLIASSVTIVLAWASLQMGKPEGFKKYMAITIALSVIFFLIKIIFEYGPKFAHGITPATNNFYAIYFTITGLHALHVLGGVVVNTYFLLPGFSMYKTEPERFTGRIECAGLYWHFVDLVWIFAFPILYLL